MDQRNSTTRRALLKGAPTALAALTAGTLLQRPAEASGYAEPKTLLTPEQSAQIHAAYTLATEQFAAVTLARNTKPITPEFLAEFRAALAPLEALMEQLAAEVTAAMPMPDAPGSQECIDALMARSWVAAPMADAFAKALKLRRSAPQREPLA